MISEMTLAEGSPTLQNVGRQGGGARGYCHRAQGRDGPFAQGFHGNIGRLMTSSTAAPSAQDPVNDEKDRKRKAPQIPS